MGRYQTVNLVLYALMIFAKYIIVHKIAKFKYSKSPHHVLQTYIHNIFTFRESEIFQTAENGRNFGQSVKNVHSLKIEIFYKYLNRILTSHKFSFQICIMCLCYFNRSQIIDAGGGEEGRGAAPHSSSVLYSAKVCNFINAFSSSAANTVMNVICAIVFGSRYDINDPEFQTVIEYNTLLAQGFGNTDAIAFLPWLRYLPIKSLRVGLENILKSNSLRDPILKKRLDEHRDTMTPGKIRDFTDAILAEAKTELRENKQSCLYLTDDHLHMILNDIFTAGAETTITALRWTFAYLCHFPQMQDRIYKELRTVVGNDRWPTLQDRGELPYLEATIHEVLRKTSFIPLGVPHTTTCDTTLMGYKIHKGTFIIFNIWAIHNDERHWEAPDEFRPERWLDENDQLILGARPSYLPFSAGRRVCLGESLAKTELFLFLSHVMFRYKIVKAQYKPLPSLEGTLGVTHAPTQYDIVLIHRNGTEHIQLLRKD